MLNCLIDSGSNGFNSCSCWFIGDFKESALMWRSYSDEGGIAVRINFGHFKERIKSYFYIKNKYEPFEGVQTINAGKVKYSEYYFDKKWISDIQKGTPIGFFKHYSYQQENEYRILIQTEDPNSKSLTTIIPFLIFNVFQVKFFKILY